MLVREKMNREVRIEGVRASECVKGGDKEGKREDKTEREGVEKLYNPSALLHLDMLVFFTYLAPYNTAYVVIASFKAIIE